MPGVLNQWVIYFNPSDYPGKYVARMWTVSATAQGGLRVDPQAHVRDTLEAARDVVADHFPDGYYLGRQPGDDPSIVEVWT